MARLQSIVKHIIQEILILAVVMLLFSCSMISATKNTDSKAYLTKEDHIPLQISQEKSKRVLNHLSIKSHILDQYANWKGVRYHLGGNTKKGIDCSAFVQITFREQFGLELPRSTYGQSRIGKSVSRSNLRAGDLLLFQASARSRHIGIYIGNDQFVHASTSSGVTISNLNKPYWKKRYNIARRVLLDEKEYY